MKYTLLRVNLYELMIIFDIFKQDPTKLQINKAFRAGAAALLSQQQRWQQPQGHCWQGRARIRQYRSLVGTLRGLLMLWEIIKIYLSSVLYSKECCRSL